MRCRPHLKGVRTKCCYLQPKNIHNLSDGPKVPKSRLVLPSDTSISFVKACWPSKLRRLVEAFTPVRTRFLPSKSPVARPGVAAAAAARLLPREGGSCLGRPGTVWRVRNRRQQPPGHRSIRSASRRLLPHLRAVAGAARRGCWGGFRRGLAGSRSAAGRLLRQEPGSNRTTAPLQNRT